MNTVNQRDKNDRMTAFRLEASDNPEQDNYRNPHHAGKDNSEIVFVKCTKNPHSTGEDGRKKLRSAVDQAGWIWSMRAIIFRPYST